ncbi:MAG: sugar phosphate isomerase/epimerase, partial [Candidatus Latescibacteria bacterium]|nr:sugar phosphate isomerase/epimerase [Candidatus Latescibacterota bacterium]
MSRKPTRRQALTAGAVSAGMFIGTTCSSPQKEQNEQVEKPQGQSIKGPGREAFWGPGPNKNLARDLKPGQTTVRLAGYLRYQEGKSIGEEVKRLRDAGLAACITGVDPWHSMQDSVVRELKAALEQYDVVIFEVGGYRNILHTDESVRREYMKHLARCLETADKIGCRMVGTISGSRNPEGNKWGDNYAVHPDNWTMETWNLLISSLKQILKDTAGLKAALGMEAQVTTNIDGPLAHRRLMDDIGDERIKVNLDPTNMVHLYNHFHTTELINECFDLLGEDIYGCHAKDSYVLPHSQTVHVQEVCPGRGSLDYETYLVRLSRLEWSRSLLPEHIP